MGAAAGLAAQADDPQAVVHWPWSKDQAPPLERKYSSIMISSGRASWTGHSYRQLALEGYENNPVVYACVAKIAKAIGGIELKLYDHTRQGKLRGHDSHGILDLINAPNLTHSGRGFVEKLITHYLIGGNAYVASDNGEDRVPNQLYLLQPDRVTVHNPLARMVPESYKYQPGGATEYVYPVNQVTGGCGLLHLKTANPLDERYGLSPMAAASYAIDVFNAAQEWNKSLLQNEARPSGALQMRQGKDGYAPVLGDDQFIRLKAEVDAMYSGSSNAGRPLLLDSALEWVQMSLNPSDMDHKETLLTNARFIAGVYGVPPMLVNIPGESTFSNFEQANLSFYTDTVLPLLGLILDDINRWLPRLFGEPKMFLWYDEETIPALEARRKEKFTRIQAASFMTPDEKRLSVGMEAYVPPAQTGANSLFQDAKLIPIEKAGVLDPNLHPELATDAKPPGGSPGKAPAESVE